MVLVCELVEELQHIEQLAKLQASSGLSETQVASEQCDAVMARIRAVTKVDYDTAMVLTKALGDSATTIGWSDAQRVGLLAAVK